MAVRPNRQCNRNDRQPEELTHPERLPQPPFVPRPMFRNPESGHGYGRTAGRATAVTLSGLTSIVGSLSATSGWTVFLPRRVAAKMSPQLKSSRPVAAVADGASMTTSAHASSHTGDDHCARDDNSHASTLLPAGGKGVCTTEQTAPCQLDRRNDGSW